MSNDFHERTNIMAVAQWIGQWAWVIAPWFWVILYDQGGLQNQAEGMGAGWLAGLLPEEGWFVSADLGVRELAIWIGIICMLLGMVPAIFIKSKSTLNDESLAPLSIKNIGSSLGEIGQGFIEAFQNKPFRRLCISTFLVFNSFNTIAAFSFFIIVYHMFSGDAGAAGIWPTLHGSLGAIATTFMVIPIITRMSKIFGKKQTFLISQAISIVGYIMFWFLFVPGKPYLFLIALPFFSFGIGSLFTLMMSMTADVCDLDELRTDKRREGLFGAIYWLMVKFGQAFAGLLSGLIMAYVGFTAGADTQPDGAITGLRIFYSALPIAGTVIAIIVMWNYDLTEAKAHEIRAELDAKKAAKGKVEMG
jgi:GPH family glycoside/pentoside/hexuronide:cation symporter